MGLLKNMDLKANDLPLKGILLVTDLDGTFISSNGEIPRRNTQAIERFTKKGGLFAFATGRADSAALRYAGQAALNAPCIVYNGAAIYDYQKKKFLWSRYLPHESADILEQAWKRFPDVGVEIYYDGKIFLVRNNEYTERHIAYEKLDVLKIKAEDLPKNWNKALFAADKSRLLEIAEFLEIEGHDGWDYVFSTTTYYEALPAGVTKGSTVKVLADMLNISHNMIMGIGDYYNDLELIKASAVSAVPAEAPDELKAIADVVVGSCGEGAVADFVEYIEEHYE
jgi:Cof subfamily protein (haloacid dehalogenase superfamily)